jgi:hypothetical protein
MNGAADGVAGLEIDIAAGGSGAGESALKRFVGLDSSSGGKQQLAAMSRGLTASLCTATSSTATVTPEQYALGIDKVMVLGGNCDVSEADADDATTAGCPSPLSCINNICTRSCSVDADCAGVHAPGASAVTCDTATNTCKVNGTSFNTLTAQGASANDWKTPLRMLMFGLPPVPASGTVTANCGDPARATLASSYNLYHIYVRDNASGTTSFFQSSLGAANASFCNAPGIAFTNNRVSLNDKSDNDPIRIACDSDEDVCRCDGTLGLILPMSVPGVDPAEIPASVLYPDAPCSNALGLNFGNPADPLGGNEKNASNRPAVPSPWIASGHCIDGSKRINGGCIFPKSSSANGGTGSCVFVNKPNSAVVHPFVQSLRDAAGNCPTSDAVNDERAWNLDVRVPTPPTGSPWGGPANSFLSLPLDNGTVDFWGRAWFRIHAWDGSDTGTGNASENPTAGGTHSLAAEIGVGCQKFDATEQIGCLVARDAAHYKRSIAFGGLQAVQATSVMPASRNNDGAVTTEIGNALVVNGELFDSKSYIMRRKLFVNSLTGLAAAQDNLNADGDEKSFFKCITSNPSDIVGTAMVNNGFLRRYASTAAGGADLTGALSVEGACPAVALPDP